LTWNQNRNCCRKNAKIKTKNHFIVGLLCWSHGTCKCKCTL